MGHNGDSSSRLHAVQATGLLPALHAQEQQRHKSSQLNIQLLVGAVV